MKGMWVGLLLAFPLAVSAGSATLQLNGAATTSAGIFDSSGRLLRTLWSGQRRSAGPVQVQWDGRDDDGAPVPATGSYVARLLAHDVKYEWEGVIGNTSSAAPGTQIHRAYGRINDMAFDASGKGFYVVGYNELGPAIHAFRAEAPRERRALSRDDYRRVFRYAATDGELAYFANIGLAAKRGSALRDAASFVVALRVADGSEYRFTAGQDRSTAINWESVIDLEDRDLEAQGRFLGAPTGLAVQRRDRHLFVAHAGLDEVRVLDKRSGALLDRIPVDEPSDLDVGPDDSFWVLCRVAGKPAVVRYRRVEEQWTSVTTVTEVGEPLAIGVSPQDGSVLVADKRSNQILAFSVSGQLLWRFGAEGGYRSGGPAVSADRFDFDKGPAYIAFQADGSFWVSDPANERSLRFSPDRDPLGEIMYMPSTRVVAVDAARPGRVFRHFLEFEVDYALPLRESWQLVRNWSPGLDRRYSGEFEGFSSVLTLANGRTYGVVRRFDINASEVFELAPGGLRAAGIRLEPGDRIYPDGSLRLHRVRAGSLHVYTRRLTGFDEQHDPIWGAAEEIVAVTGLKERDPYYHEVPFVPGVNGPVFPETDGGTIVSFNPGKNPGFHLGGLRRGMSGWLWRASPDGTWKLDEEGRVVVSDGSYELGRGVQYPGSVALTAGRHILFGYHGEAWNGGQANQWLHFLDNGLFVGQFGRPAYPSGDKTVALPGTAGNAFSPQLAVVSGRIYLWHNDEGVQGGVHRWRLNGLDTIRLLEAPITP